MTLDENNSISAKYMLCYVTLKSQLGRYFTNTFDDLSLYVYKNEGISLF